MCQCAAGRLSQDLSSAFCSEDGALSDESSTKGGLDAVTVSARSNRELSQFWGMILAAMTCLLIGLELVVTPAQKTSSPPADRRAGNAVMTHRSAEQAPYGFPATG
jgi:hypothetical protein